MNKQTFFKKKHMTGLLFSSLAFMSLPSLAVGATDFALPVSPNNVYDLTTFAENGGFAPLTTYSNAWCVLNPKTADDEVAKPSLDILWDDDAQSRYLAFDELNLSPEAYLALRIGTLAGNDYTPYALEPTTTNMIEPRELVITTRFEPSSELPSIDDLQHLVLTTTPSLDNPEYYAAKVGVVVKDDNFFYILRAKAGAEGTLDTNAFEWVKTNVAYMPEPAAPLVGVTYVGKGRVDLKVEAYVYRAGADTHFMVAYRLAVQGTNGAYVSLSKDLGYSWSIDNESLLNGVYAIDFSSFTKGEWLFPFDSASASVNDELVVNSFDTWSRIGFSAFAGGGLYKVALNEGAAVDNVNTLAMAYDVGRFSVYGSLTSPTFSLFADWVNRYNVNLSEHLVKTTPTTMFSTFALSTGCETAEEAFNAFLLDMDPKESVVQKLTVTSVVPEATQMVLTVIGPEGCSLQNALSRAGRLYVKRAASLMDLATIDALPLTAIDGAAIAVEGDELFVTLPRYNAEGEEMPFVQVTLDAVEE